MNKEDNTIKQLKLSLKKKKIIDDAENTIAYYKSTILQIESNLALKVQEIQTKAEQKIEKLNSEAQIKIEYFKASIKFQEGKIEKA